MKKQVIFTMGLPASGKSTFIETYFKTWDIIDPDKYEAEEHSTQISLALTDMWEKIREEKDFIFLSTGRSYSFSDTLQYLKDKGYYVTIFYIKEDFFKCVKRNNSRERRVPDLKLIREQMINNIPMCRKIADSFITIDMKITNQL